VVDYRPALGKSLPFLIAGFFLVLGPVVTVVMLRGGLEGLSGAPPVAFTVLWIAPSVWGLYQLLFTTAVALSLQEDLLRWEAPLRTGEVPVAALTGVRSLRFSELVAFDRSDGKPIRLQASEDLSAFLLALSTLRPDLSIDYRPPRSISDWLRSRGRRP
jgi:hypothetical protein